MSELPAFPSLLPAGESGEMFHRFCRDLAGRIVPANPVPETADEWPAIRDARRAQLRRAISLSSLEPCPLNPEITLVEEMGDYALERILLQTRPGLIMTAHMYVPRAPVCPAPAVLSVHGHWPLAKSAPPVQARCIALAKLGLFVLCVDAIGAGERAYRGDTYHGKQQGAQALPPGIPLPGLQVWDNMRALDYLCSRPEIDPRLIACTGESGGGNQTVLVSALDDRIAVSVPVVCMGSYRGYVNGAHCACEMVPGLLRMFDSADMLAMIAPRPLLVIAATRDDGAGFQIDDLRARFPKLERVYELLGARDRVARCEVDMPHGYELPMREATYAWIRRWLLGIRADLCPEPALETRESETILCLPHGMPERSETIPSLAYKEARRLALSYPPPPVIPETRASILQRIESEAFGGFPKEFAPEVEEVQTPGGPPDTHGIVVTTEPGIRVPILLRGEASGSACLLWLDPDGKATALASQRARGLQSDSLTLAAADLRGVGETLWQGAAQVGASDYQLFQNGIVLGRPMLGMWVWDALQCIKVLRGRFARVIVAGRREMALVALMAAAFDEEVAEARCEELLAGFAYPERFSGDHALSLFVPNLLKFADVPQIAALVAPRRLTISRPVDGGNNALSGPGLDAAFRYTKEAYGALLAREALTVE